MRKTSESVASDLLRKEEAGVLPSSSDSRVEMTEMKEKSTFQQDMREGAGILCY